MDFKSQRLKRKRTRRELDDLRKQSHKMSAAKEYTIINKSISLYNSELVKCNLIPLELFTKTVRSKTVIRVPIYKINNIKNVKDGKRNISTKLLSHSQNTLNGACKNNSICENKINNALDCRKVGVCGIGDRSKEIHIVTPRNPSNNDLTNLKDSIFEEFYYKDNCSCLNNCSCSNSAMESDDCLYVKFMNDFPIYLKEHFPSLSSNFQIKNETYLKKIYFENTYQEKKHNTLNSIESSKTCIPKSFGESIIQDPMNYIRSSSLWEESLKRRRMSVPSSPDLPLPQFISNTSDIFLNSPEYIYFPHKLNQ